MFSMAQGRNGGDGERRSWFGMGGRPKLPYYFRTKKRLKSLDEFEEPYWKGQLRWPGDDRVTPGGIARDTLRWLAIFAIVGIVGGSAWLWLSGGESCARIVGGFKAGWC